MRIIANDHFAGGGLLALGLCRAGIEVQQSFEIDRVCCEVMRANFGHEVVRCDLAKKLVANEKPCHVRVFTYPCTKYSEVADLHGTRTGDEMYLHAFRHMAIDPPEIYMAENVPGMKKFPVVMEAMTRLPSYYVTVFCPVSSQLWLPQRRDRLIIIGSRKRFDWRAPKASRCVSLAEILEDRPKVDVPDYVLRRLRGEYRDRPIISDPKRGDIAPTCVAHYSKDMSTRLVADKRYRYGARPYTVREYARLQGVPDSFQFPCGDSKAFQIIGNGVSIPVGEWFGHEVKRYLRK